MKHKKFLRLPAVFLLSLVLWSGSSYSEEKAEKKADEKTVEKSAEKKERLFKDKNVVGQAFAEAVTDKDFFYYYKTASLFSRNQKESKTDEEVREEAWQNLVFSRGAREVGLEVTREELEQEISRLVSEKEIEYGTPDYGIWVITQLKDDVGTFEKRIEDLLLVNKLLKLKADADVTVTEEEIEQKFLNQYNSFESEYIRFDSKEEAEEFRKRVSKDRSLWKTTYDEKRKDGQKGATWINVMSLEALIDLWKIPKDDAYRILGSKPGDFITAEFFYGDAVFRLLNKKTADMEKFDEAKKEYYRKTISAAKKREISKEYFDDLIARADIRDYVFEDERERKIKDMKKTSLVALETNQGTIEIKLFPEAAPLACENFLGLIEKGYYNGLIFHRVIKDFMIQGGDPTGTGGGGDSMWGQPFVDEVSDAYKFDKPGILAMANSGADTNKSQFFITTKPTPWLNNKHTIFGEVTKGFDVVQAIEGVETSSGDKPVKEQSIVKAYVVGKTNPISE
ncbi:MAG: peptidylprolyl isomerase [Candidatus Omnitrophota bacterium]